MCGPWGRTVHGEAMSEAVVLMHAGGMSSRQWRKLSELLQPTHRVIAPDFLGVGENPPWPDDKPFDYSMDVEAIERRIDGLDRVHLVGHSYGGLIALLVAERRPERVASLALFDPVAYGVLYQPEDQEGLRDLARASQNPLFFDDTRGGGDEWFEAFVDYWNGPGTWRAMPEPARAAQLRVGKKVYQEVRSLLGDRRPASIYARITAPSLLLTGERTPRAARRVIAILSSVMPRARVQVIAGAGHMGPITHGELVARAVADHVIAATQPG